MTHPSIRLPLSAANKTHRGWPGPIAAFALSVDERSESGTWRFPSIAKLFVPSLAELLDDDNQDGGDDTKKGLFL
jgi:hypothetical protein